MAIDRMAAQVQTERILFVRQQLHFGPRRRIRQPDDREVVVVAAAEEIRLAELAIALGAVAVLDRAVDGAEQLGASRGQADAGRDNDDGGSEDGPRPSRPAPRRSRETAPASA